MEKFLYKNTHLFPPFLHPEAAFSRAGTSGHQKMLLTSCDCGEMICNFDSVEKSFKAIHSIPEDYLIHPELFLSAEVNLVFLLLL